MRNDDTIWPTFAALAYALIVYAGGLALIVSGSPPLDAIGVVAIAHASVIAAYLQHECMHNAVFARGRANARLGRALGWITGACYARYERLRDKHFRHHLERADVVAFDYRARLARRPRLLRALMVLEWAYIPAVEVLLRAWAIARPFAAPAPRAERVRTALVLAVRVALFAALTWRAPVALPLYALAYVLFLTVMRFMDAFQHTYEVFETLERDRSGWNYDRAYEQRNTYSNLLSVRHPWVNALTLNFSYHNAHHERPTTPWHRLPALHRELYAQGEAPVLPVATLLKTFHRHRLTRILQGDAPDSNIAQRGGQGFVGVDGVSFLLPI